MILSGGKKTFLQQRIVTADFWRGVNRTVERALTNKPRNRTVHPAYSRADAILDVRVRALRTPEANQTC